MGLWVCVRGELRGGYVGGETRGRNGAFMLRTHTHRSEPLCSYRRRRHAQASVCTPHHTIAAAPRLRLTPGRRAENTDSTVTCRNSTSVPQRDQLRCEHISCRLCLRAVLFISISSASLAHVRPYRPYTDLPTSYRPYTRAHLCATKRDVRFRVFTCTGKSPRSYWHASPR